MYDGESLVRRAAIAATSAGALPVIVVLGADAEQISSAMSDLPAITIAFNAQWQTGLASSLSTGLRALEGSDIDAALVTLADQPLVDGPALERLMSAFGDDRRIVASAYQGTIGVPAIFGKEHIPDLLQLTGDKGAGAWLRQRPDELTLVPLSAAAVDIDTREDTARLGDG